MWLEGSITIKDMFGILAYCIMHNIQCPNMFKSEYEKHCACINAHFKQPYATLQYACWIQRYYLRNNVIVHFSVCSSNIAVFEVLHVNFFSAHLHRLLFTLQVHRNSFYKQIKFSLFLVGWKGANVFWLQMRSTVQRSSD